MGVASRLPPWGGTGKIISYPNRLGRNMDKIGMYVVSSRATTAAPTKGSTALEISFKDTFAIPQPT